MGGNNLNVHLPDLDNNFAVDDLSGKEFSQFNIYKDNNNNTSIDLSKLQFNANWLRLF
jgi:hypothetical protein